MVHPLTSAVYEEEDDGSVRVTDADGREGWFSADGGHLRGELRNADPHILDWVGGRKPSTQRVGRLRLGPQDAAAAGTAQSAPESTRADHGGDD